MHRSATLRDERRSPSAWPTRGHMAWTGSPEELTQSHIPGGSIVFAAGAWVGKGGAGPLAAVSVESRLRRPAGNEGALCRSICGRGAMVSCPSMLRPWHSPSAAGLPCRMRWTSSTLRPTRGTSRDPRGWPGWAGGDVRRFRRHRRGEEGPRELGEERMRTATAHGMGMWDERQGRLFSSDFPRGVD